MDGVIADSVGVGLSELGELMMDRGAWRAAVLGVTESQTRQSGRATAAAKTQSLSGVCPCPSVHHSGRWHGHVGLLSHPPPPQGALSCLCLFEHRAYRTVHMLFAFSTSSSARTETCLFLFICCGACHSMDAPT